MEGNRSSDNCYLLASPNICLNTVQNDHSLWHKRLGHINHNSLKDTIATKTIREVPNLKVKPKRMYVPCQLGKQIRTSHIESQLGSTNRVLELSIAGKRYVYVCIDDFSRFTWANFLRTKSDTFEAFEEIWQGLSKEHNNRLQKMTRIRSDHGKEFENSFCKSYGKNCIKHEFLAPKTPQQNVVAKRKNRTLQEMDRFMLKSRNVPTKFWA